MEGDTRLWNDRIRDIFYRILDETRPYDMEEIRRIGESEILSAEDYAVTVNTMA